MAKTLTLSASAFLLLAVTGCGEYGGGASVVPTVEFIPADLSGDGANEAAGADTAAEASTESGGMGSIVGRVVLVGDAPNLAPLISQGADVKDKEVCAAITVPDERLVLGAGNGVANAFVYLPRRPKGTPALESSDTAIIFDQKNCQFLPHALVVPTGQLVKVLSGDSVAHNTHSYPNKNQGVNSGVAPNDREGKLTITYNRAEAEPIAVKCDYHAWMNAYHLPIDHSFAAVTDADGNFEIKDLPAGKYAFAVWHESADGKFIERKLSVTVGAGDPTSVEIAYPAEKLKL